jgi:hypothetical protein
VDPQPADARGRVPQVTEAYEWQDRTVLDQDREKIDTVKDVYTDYQTGI